MNQLVPIIALKYRPTLVFSLIAVFSFHDDNCKDRRKVLISAQGVVCGVLGVARPNG